MANTSLSKLRSKTRLEMKLDKIWRVWNDDELTDAINEAILEVQNYWNFKWSENRDIFPLFDSVPDQQAYDLPDDFQSADLVKIDWKELDSADFIELKAFYSSFPSWTPINYSIFGWKLQLTPITTIIWDIDLTYRKFLPTLTDNADLSPFSLQFDRAIVLFASYALLTKPGDAKNFSRAQIKFDKRYKWEISKLYNAFLLPDRNQLQYKNSYRSPTRRISRRTFN